MKMNRIDFINKLIEKTKFDEEQCSIINDIIQSHHIVGRKNKESFISEFMSRLNINYEEADKLYNICMEIIILN